VFPLPGEKPGNPCFDIIISDSTLDHYRDKSDINTSLDELVRVLKPGGTLIITLDNPHNWSEPLFRLWIFLGLSPFYIGKTFSLGELEEALTRRGLCVTEGITLIHNPRFFTKVVIAVIRQVFPRHYYRWVNRMLRFFDTLGDKPSRFLTAQFIAAKAVKPADH